MKTTIFYGCNYDIKFKAITVLVNKIKLEVKLKYFCILLDDKSNWQAHYEKLAMKLNELSYMFLYLRFVLPEKPCYNFIILKHKLDYSSSWDLQRILKQRVYLRKGKFKGFFRISKRTSCRYYLCKSTYSCLSTFLNTLLFCLYL